MTLTSSNVHPKQLIQFLFSIASATSVPAVPESFDTTHVTSSPVKLRGSVLGNSSDSSKALQEGFLTGGLVCPGAFPGGPLKLVHQS